MSLSSTCQICQLRRVLPHNIHKACIKDKVRCIVSTHGSWTATPCKFQHLQWRNTNIWLHGIKHLHRSSRSYPNSTGSRAGGSELGVDFQIAFWMCARFAFFPNASSEGDSDLTKLQHGPRACSKSRRFRQANDSQLCTSWISPE